MAAQFTPIGDGGHISAIHPCSSAGRVIMCARGLDPGGHMFVELPDSSASFYNSILFHSIAALKLNTFVDNFDAARFNIDGIDHSKEFNAGERAYFFDWFFRNHSSLFAAYSLLGNETSKRLYLYLIAYRLAGHFSIRLPVDFAGRMKEFEDYKAIEKCAPSQLAARGSFGNLKHFDFEYGGNRYLVDCLGLDYYLFRGQYFYHKGGVDVAPVRGDTVIDGGACTGDTAAVFSNVVGAEGCVFCFDPVADHLSILEHNVKQFTHANVSVMPFGLSDKNIFAKPIVLNQYAPGFSAGANQVPLRSIDFLVKSQKIRRIDFIKLDVEGAELDCIRGARESIQKFKPKLAISLYHKPNDLYEIIAHVKQEFPFYSCYIDHYTIHGEETVLYCRGQEPRSSN
jgi:FkbM family methyltransferase